MPEENGPKENGQSKLEKSSVRRMLNKCRESNLLAKEPGKSNDVPYLGFMSDLSHPMDLQAHSQADDSKSAADVLFEGKITDVMQKGYTIETIINGKVLRGMLFPSTTSSIQDGHAYSHKRRTKLNEHQPLSTAVQIMPQDTKISDQIVATCAKESMNETVIVEPATMLYQKIDSKKLELSAMPNQELNNVLENLEPLLMPSEIAKNDDVSDKSQKTGAYEHRFQVEDHEKIDMDKRRDQM